MVDYCREGLLSLLHNESIKNYAAFGTLERLFLYRKLLNRTFIRKNMLF